VLDVAEPALATARARLGAKAASVSWIAADITRWTPGRRWRIWHDRAVFHFLTERAMQDAYIGALLAGTEPDATAIIATFAPDGPATCSGLTVARYSAETLAERIGASFALGSAAREIHTTPAGVQQPFVYAVLKRQARQERLRSPLP
jgi:trans-aconitate methyltransferase